MPILWCWIFLIAGNIPVYIGIGWVLFDNWATFAREEGDERAQRHWRVFDPDRDDRDPFAGWKMNAFFVLCAGVVFLEHLAISRWF